jgi:hypothetical protein
MTAGEFVALLVTDTPPLSVPATVGAKCTLNVALCPAVKLSGVVSPLAVKPLPETASCEMLTLALPVFVSVTGWLLLLPTCTPPKFRLPGLALSFRVAAVPLPLSGTEVGDVEALLATAKAPVELFVEVGVKLTVNLAD